MTRKHLYFIFIIATAIVLVYSCRKAQPFNDKLIDERFLADVQTAFDESGASYGNLINGLTAREEAFHDLGDQFFETNFVPNQSKYHANGLGPLYNNLSCASCHASEGRGRAPYPGEKLNSMFFKLSSPGIDALGFPNKLAGYGIQLQDKAIAGITPEGSVSISYVEQKYMFPDGEIASLRKPTYILTNLYTPIMSQVNIGPRVARPTIGMGFLESISEESILKNSDPNDLNQDGISGKPNYVYDFVNKKSGVLGRIGWKASVANIKSQVSKALTEDIGITNYIVVDDNANGQIQSSNFTGIEVPDSIVDALTFYMRTLTVPARRNVKNEEVILGKKLFYTLGCASCHVPNHQTKVDPSFRPLSGLNIYPYTDLLLHDMGSGLGDGFAEFEATGSEWRTPPLWGIGLSQKVSGHSFFLHDGRARNFQEAILWHGGEASKTVTQYANLSIQDRKALLLFLENL